MKSSCPECDLPIKVEATSCPHCGRPSRFPNINFVTTEEQEALEQRYQHSLQTSPSPEELKTYQNKVTEAECVIARSFDELKRLLASDNLIYETFYMRVKAGRQKYQHQSWDRLRAITDNIIFGETLKENIRFGSLTLDGNGLPHYGECYWILHTDLISHRTSLFEENTVTFCQTHNTQGSNDFNLPKGYRAKWEEAGKLAVAKLEGNTEAIKNHATCLQSPGSNK